MDVSFIKSCSNTEKPKVDAEVEENMRFNKSLQELRELRCQLHHAADYCETTFSKSQEKRDMVENTKEYICRTMVTVVDHIGNVSANLEVLISQTYTISEAELRIQCLQQRLLTRGEYARKFGFAKLQWSENLPRFHARYLLSTPPLQRSSSKRLIRDSESQIPSEIEDRHVHEPYEDLPLFMYTHKSHPTQMNPTTTTVKEHNNLAIVPVRADLAVLTEVPNPTFNFQRTQKVGRHRRSLYGSDFLWHIRRTTKRTH